MKTIYGVRVGAVEVAETRPNGEAWDPTPVGRAPDISVEVGSAGWLGLDTPVAENTVEHTFDTVLPLTAAAGDVVALAVYNRNYSREDVLIGKCSLVLSEADLAAGGVTVACGSVERLVLSFADALVHSAGDGEPRRSPPGAVEAPASVRQIKVGTVRVAAKTPEGKNWDPEGRLTEKPDLFVRVRKPVLEPCATRTAGNVYTHRFDEALAVTCGEFDTLRIRVVDRDLLTEDDLIGECLLTVLPEDLGAGGVQLAFGSVKRLDLTFDTTRPAEYQPPANPVGDDPRV